MEAVTNFFENNPMAEACYSTSDGFVFGRRPDADAHSFSLENKAVETHKKTEAGTEAVVLKVLADLDKTQKETAAIIGGKNAQQVQTIASDLVQKNAENKVSEAATDVVKVAAEGAAAGLIPSTTDGTQDVAGALAGNAAAEAGADKVKTQVTAPEYKEKTATKKDLETYPELAEQGVKVGDKIQVPVSK